MAEEADTRQRKQTANRSVLGGVILMALALLASSLEAAPDLLTTGVAVGGFVLVMYGVHVGWLIFYERDPEGPSS